MLTEVIGMVTGTDTPKNTQELDSAPKTVLLLENEEQRLSLQDPIRRQILNVLSSGLTDYSIETTTDTKTLEDGTDVTHLVEMRKPYKRYWMTVPEIMEGLNQRHREPQITNYQCYYHLEKLRDQKLVVQDPVQQDKERDQQIRVRGKQFQIVARFFVSNCSKTRLKDFTRLLETLNKGLGVTLSEADEERLRELISKQDHQFLSAFEHLATMLAENELNQATFPFELERLVYVYLSEDTDFLEQSKETRDILIRSGATSFEENNSLKTSKKKEQVRGIRND